MTIDITTEPEALVVGLIPGTMYRLRLVAVNEAGKSDPSEEVEFRTAVSGKPGLY